MAQRVPNTETKVTGVCIHETRSDASIAAMTMNQCQFIFTHLPSLLHNFPKSSVEHNLRRMIPVKINFHLWPLIPVLRTNWMLLGIVLGTLNNADRISE